MILYSKSHCILEINPLVLGVLVSIVFILGLLLELIKHAPYSFLTASISTTLLSLLKSAGVVFSLSMSILSISAFTLAKSDFAAKVDVQHLLLLLNQLLKFDYINLIQILHFY